MMPHVVDEFKTAMAQAGVTPPSQIAADGRLHRFTVNGDRRGSQNGYYAYYSGEPAGGIFGCWKRSVHETWVSKTVESMSPSQRKAYAENVERIKRQHEAEIAEQRQAFEAWSKVWHNAKAAPASHPYLVKKGVPAAIGLKITDDRLMVPVTDFSGNLQGVQFIFPDGTKQFQKGTVKRGHFFRLGSPNSNEAIICEGLSTGISIHKATGHTVFVAFDSGNLRHVAEALRAKFPDVRILVAADDDAHNKDGSAREPAQNVGINKANEAALAVGGAVVVPEFPSTRQATHTDFNDLEQLAGLETVQKQFEAALRSLPKSASHEVSTSEPGTWPAPINLARLASQEPTPPKFIIQDWLPCGYATLFAGHGGVGKSGIALALAVCLAAGLPFYGLPVERRRILYLSCEDRQAVLHWRLSRICTHLGIEMSSMAGWLDIVDLVGHDAILYQPRRDATPLTGAYRQLAARINASQTQVLIVDGISDTYDGNENARAEVKAYVNAMLALIPPDDGAVILVGHVAKPASAVGVNRMPEGYSGSTGWHNSVRARWYLFPDNKGDTAYRGGRKDLILELQKSNLGPTDGRVRFAWDDLAGLFTGEVEHSVTHLEQDLAAEEEREAILRALLVCTEPVPAATSGQRTAYHVLSAQPGFPAKLVGQKAERQRFWAHIEKLRAMGLVKEGSHTRTDRHKMSTLVASDHARRDCGRAGNAENSHSPHYARTPLCGHAGNAAGGYKGGPAPAHGLAEFNWPEVESPCVAV